MQKQHISKSIFSLNYNADPSVSAELEEALRVICSAQHANTFIVYSDLLNMDAVTYERYSSLSKHKKNEVHIIYSRLREYENSTYVSYYPCTFDAIVISREVASMVLESTYKNIVDVRSAEGSFVYTFWLILAELGVDVYYDDSFEPLITHRGTSSKNPMPNWKTLYKPIRVNNQDIPFILFFLVVTYLVGFLFAPPYWINCILYFSYGIVYWMLYDIWWTNSH